MTPQAVEFIVEACVQHEGPIITTDWRDVARLAVRMGVAWEAAMRADTWAKNDEPDGLPEPLMGLVRFNWACGTLDAPTWPEVK